jgi:gamma-glutamylcyclotransferase (GGCT)/AIG2-like uncharacterized protein YtfP
MSKSKTIKTVKVFVYGTLKMSGHFARQFDKYRLHSEPAKVKGQIWDLGSYPGMTPHEVFHVSGQLHTYSDPVLVMDKMDMIEGVYNNTAKDLFYRERVLVTSLDGKREDEAWAYFFNGNVYNRTEITTGIWIND